MGRIVLLRHAEAAKNAEHRHGGPGTSLTALGLSQALEFARSTKDLFPDLQCVYFIGRPQCYETAVSVHSEIGVPLAEIEGLGPFSLGVLDGLSDEEARVQYPDCAQMMDEWRLGLIDISQVKIPGATDVHRYFAQGKQFLAKVTAEHGAFLVVGTRSVLVLLWNILKEHHPGPGGSYFERPWSNCEWVEFMKSTGPSWSATRGEPLKGKNYEAV
jgi:broad specificity phosphatase PhoE